MKSRSARDAAPASFRWRSLLLQGLLAISALALAWRAVNLQLVDHGFLAREGDARFSRVLEIAAHRGTITDRYGEPLAVSTPVDSVWVNPRELALATEQIPRLAAALKLDRQELARRVTSNLEREFLYLARHRQPAEAEQIKALGIPGVYTSREYRRYYPTGEVTGHLLGFTNVDDAGQEGLELASKLLPARVFILAGDRVRKYPQGHRTEAGEAGQDLAFLRGGRTLHLIEDIEGADCGKNVAGLGLVPTADFW